ncbi:hypothetical protein DPT59_12460 [Salmonella enterica subsp. enterica serovar Stanleyville]|uniref:glyoxalase superfamily protein n=1 Tax=Salmonella enterica TaxID=28901 RepID=UPI0008AA72B2|nr:glyoxalase superfamily protein [Salmonella enterica]EBQ9564243.1 hypothetical protein [Salmonella enterica subsp. enterica serovar Stanleyville]AOZ30231.1 hypothetical protein SES26_020185 [Salmonella enterica subsp. enterica serovar Saintpaul str. SARA26]EBS3858154.1 hypothetical protein [Salmonella enterica subsp. enterica serovar Stanleyville]EBW9552155.1 hypothetical protein [Salmonella enterica subsp. enterica serovar Stanleyville]ECE8935735.1 hypothetical protein [Salmonella enterica 
MNLKNITLDDVKVLSKRLCENVNKEQLPLTHSKALNVISSMLGYRNYNTLRAQHTALDPAELIDEKQNKSNEKLVSFLSHVFTLNTQFQTNMQCVYLPAFSESQIELLEKSTSEALNILNRNFVFVDARDKSALAICESITNSSFRTVHNGFTAVKEMIMNTDIIIILIGISKANMARKEGFTRGLIKTIDDAHFKNVIPESNIIFIDYASFLEKNWDYIGPYLSVFGRSYYMPS